MNIEKEEQLQNQDQQQNYLNIFKEIDLKESDKKKRFELYFEEIKKQYQNILTSTSTSSTIKNIDWIINLIRTIFEFKLKNKEEKKKLIQWLFKNLILSIDILRSKYKEQQQQQQQQKESDNNSSSNDRIKLKLWEYQIQIILRFEYLNLKEKLIEKKKLTTNEESLEDKNINQIENIVILLQDVSFLMDSIENINSNNNNNNDINNNNNNNNTTTNIIQGSFINFLENIILPRYINELKSTLIKCYKLLEISKPKLLKKDKSSLSKSGGSNNIIVNELIQENPDIESTINIDINDNNSNDKKNKKKRKDDHIQTTPPVSAGLPKDLFKKSNIKNLNHFTMSLSNPSKSFRTISTPTTTTTNNNTTKK